MAPGLMRTDLEGIVEEFGLVADLLGAETPYVFPTEEDALRLHLLAVSRGGGRFGLRDPGLLRSALHRPMQIVAYRSESASPGVLAASLCAGVAANHPFIDGNKRTGFLVAVAFLRRSGLDLRCRDPAMWHAAVVRFAAHGMSEEELAGLFEENILDAVAPPTDPDRGVTGDVPRLVAP